MGAAPHRNEALRASPDGVIGWMPRWVHIVFTVAGGDSKVNVVKEVRRCSVGDLNIIVVSGGEVNDRHRRRRRLHQRR